MAVLDRKKTIRNLKKKGFIESETKSVDHIWLNFLYAGKVRRAKTKVSHSGKDLEDFHISNMAKQIYLKKSEFLDFVNCPLSEDEYVKILRDKGFVDLKKKVK